MHFWFANTQMADDFELKSSVMVGAFKEHDDGSFSGNAFTLVEGKTTLEDTPYFVCANKKEAEEAIMKFLFFQEV